MGLRRSRGWALGHYGVDLHGPLCQDLPGIWMGYTPIVNDYLPFPQNV